jgi:CheY-like chemotaxis protein
VLTHRGETIEDLVVLDGQLRGKLIVVAEDQKALRYCIVELLQPSHATVVEATDGHALVEMLGRTRVDLVITDVRMPHLSGLEVLRARRDVGDATPFILVTGAPDPAAVRDVSAATFLAKPFTREELWQAVSKSLQVDPVDQRGAAVER